MASTSTSKELAHRILAGCLERRSPEPSDIDELAQRVFSSDEEVAHFAVRALFAGIIEPLADRFEPELCDAYVHLFSQVLERYGLDAGDLRNHYFQARRIRPVPGDPARVVVLSRVTLGADVAITSLVLDAAKQRFPASQIVFAGPEKAWQLFEKDSRLTFLPLPYGRTSSLKDRLAVFPVLRDYLSQPDTVLLDPDSRLTQLGLLPVCSETDHYLFESRAFGGNRDVTLPALTAEWLRHTLGVTDPVPYLAPKFTFNLGDQPLVTVSLGVGENPAKRVADPFEAELLRHLGSLGAVVMVDQGAGGEEAQRVHRAITASGCEAATHDGSFASFAAIIARSQLYIGYDSAGQHVAAALGIPLVTVFAGSVSDRMFQRWYPDGPGPRTVIRVRDQSVDELLALVRSAAILPK